MGRLQEKADARRTRLRAKIETRGSDSRIQTDTPREDRVDHDAFLRIGKVRLRTDPRPRLTRRGVTPKRRHVRQGG